MLVGSMEEQKALVLKATKDVEAAESEVESVIERYNSVVEQRESIANQGIAAAALYTLFEKIRDGQWHASEIGERLNHLKLELQKTDMDASLVAAVCTALASNIDSRGKFDRCAIKSAQEHLDSEKEDRAQRIAEAQNAVQDLTKEMKGIQAKL